MLAKAPLGTRDILPDQIHAWRLVEDTARKIFQLYGYREFRVPMFEHTKLFARSIGETTDIVEKEMYTFGTGEDSMTFRPEITAGLVRAYLENNLHKRKKFQKIFSIGPAFRRERPQKGRSRQFHQLDAEALGAIDPWLDAEMIILASEFFKGLGLEKFEITLNSTGCRECKPKYRLAIITALEPRLSELCDNCRKRFERNIFRVLDCKNPQCKAVTETVPNIEGHLCESCGAHHEKVKSLLKEAGVNFRTDAHLVRGLDYYTRTVFEVVSTSGGLGAQNALGGGGRYDYLISELGGPEIGAVGFALGIERILLALDSENVKHAVREPETTVYVVTVSPQEKDYAFKVVQELRSAGTGADMDFEGRSLKAQMKTANKLGVRAACIVGPDETEAGKVKIKEMESGEESVLTLREAVEKLKRI